MAQCGANAIVKAMSAIHQVATFALLTGSNPKRPVYIPPLSAIPLTPKHRRASRSLDGSLHGYR